MTRRRYWFARVNTRAKRGLIIRPVSWQGWVSFAALLGVALYGVILGAAMMMDPLADPVRARLHIVFGLLAVLMGAFLIWTKTDHNPARAMEPDR